MSVFKLPDLGEGLHEAEIAEWHVRAGQSVQAGEPLVSVETDKAIVEVPSPQAGRIERLCGAPGDRLEVGAPLVEFAAEAPAAADDAVAAAGDAVAAAAADRGTVVGRVETTDRVVTERATPVGSGASRSRATPAVRALAKRLGVELGLVTATGPGGVITATDVRNAEQELREAGPFEPLHGVRRVMASSMAQAHAEVVAVTVVDDADVDDWAPDEPLMPRLIRAIITGCRTEAALNAWFDGRGPARRVHERIDLGVAMDTPDGLFVPVLRDVAALEPAELRRALEALKADVRRRTIPPEAMRGATFTLSNFGAFGGRYADPVVVPPTVAILGAGRLRESVVAVQGRPAVHRVLPLSLTFDHRAVTGGEATRFLAAVIGDLEHGR